MPDEEQAMSNEPSSSSTTNLPTVEEGRAAVPAPIHGTNGWAAGSSSSTTAGAGPSNHGGDDNDDGDDLKNPKEFSKKLSIVSKQYDREGKGYLDDTELALRRMDDSNRGFIDMDKVFFLMEELQREQKANVNLKKAVAVLAVFAIVLALANMGTAFAAAVLAKDTTVDQTTGDLVSINTGERLGTTARKDVYVVTPGMPGVIENEEDDDLPRLLSRDDADKIWSDCGDGGSGVRLMEDCTRDGEPDTPTDLACTRRTESFDSSSGGVGAGSSGSGGGSTKRTVYQFTARRPEGAAFGTVSMVCREEGQRQGVNGETSESSSGGQRQQCDVVGMTCNDVCPDGLVCGRGQICCCNRCVGEMDICNRAWCGTGEEMLEGPV